MRAVTIMFDSLNKRYLPPYGAQDVVAPNFERLAKRAVTFDNFYCGSMPCMPARREIHTGRYNFLHRSWGPLEPFDDSMPEQLSNNGICTQFVSDHCHYWQDGGLTYHTRYSAFELVRGQEGDEWHARANGFKDFPGKRFPRRQDAINREYTRDDNSCHARCFESARDFIENNKDEDDWYLHLEYFDPHEPFDAPEKYKKLYSSEPIDFDWPQYAKVSDQKELHQAILNYKACISMCDDYLGRILDLFDAYDLWKDTLLIVNTDHGYLLGEHGYMAKNYMPCYDELSNIPFFMYDPRHKEQAGRRRTALTQTIDIAPTILDFFGCEIPDSMRGVSLEPVVADDQKVHEAILYGYFGKHINVTDGNYTYFRSARDNTKLYEYTLMPTRLASLFTKRELKMVEPALYTGLDYCGNVPVLKMCAHTPDVPVGTHHQYDGHLKYGDLLFDRIKDPHQQYNLVSDEALVATMKKKMIEQMLYHDAPSEQYERMGLDT
ncbi:MAG: sulfatase [Sphaerochaetaceae bacterium]|jgi:arylsulfatase A-like enzyme|nr:sulfatase [Sphaerochaetaceae bacterium]MDD4259633.1 sulfatase [Sphaerochaetaceae bacterium]MDX9934664.1 sulfatase [Sphaerochaetaceae bacterium]